MEKTDNRAPALYDSRRGCGAGVAEADGRPRRPLASTKRLDRGSGAGGGCWEFGSSRFISPRIARMTVEPCPVCGRFPNRPVTADAAVVRDGRILLVRRKFDPFAGRYALPGGFVDQNETPEDCAVRELREECGLDGEVDGLVGVYSGIDRDRHRHTVSFVYSVRATSSSDGEPGDDAAALLWAPLDRLPPLAFDHAAIVADLRAGIRWERRTR